MTRLFFATLALAGVACGAPTPPRYYSLDSELSEPERATIESAIDAWCVETGDCPEPALWAEHGRFQLVDSIRGRCERIEHEEGERGCITGGKNVGDRVVLISRARPAPESLDVLWTIAAHEWGHFCAEHTERGLMGAVQHADAPMLEIDADAVSAWKAGCQ